MSKTIELTRRLMKGDSLDGLSDFYGPVAHEFMVGEASPVAMSSFLTAMALRGETAESLAAFASAMRQHAIPFIPDGQLIDDKAIRIDTCGTGGDHSGTFNVSTASAFVVAGAGYSVVKHGNRGVTSKSGSADVLEALGVEIEVPPEVMHDRYEQTRFAFLFAQAYHPAMKHVGPVRRELGFRTLFNLVGPLANPARATHQVVGVYSSHLVPLVADALRLLGITGALVVHGHGGVDEITLSGPSSAFWVHEAGIQPLTIHPEELGLTLSGPADIAGGDAAYNARLVEDILLNKGSEPATNIVLLNAAAAISLVHGTSDIRVGLEEARQALESGTAHQVLEAHRALRKTS